MERLMHPSGDFLSIHQKEALKQYFCTMAISMLLCQLDTRCTLKECYENLELVLNKLSYSDHKWTLSENLKVTSMLLGQQSGCTKFPCFLCEWDSRDRKQHYIKKVWP